MNFPTIRSSYTSLLAAMQVKPQWDTAYDRAAARLLQGKSRYLTVSRQTGVPWEWIAAVHWRERAGDFRGVLHNGEFILGTGRKTSLIPAGRGPFTTWEQSALDALRLKGLHLITDWSMERCCYEFERFNGFGYRKGAGRPNSPYLWAGTNLYTIGKFTSDGNYDPSHVDQQLGAVPLFMKLQAAVPAQVLPHVSEKVKVLDRVKTAVKGFIATVAGLFTLDFMGIVREWFTFTGFFDPKLQITLGVSALLVYVLVTWISGMIEKDYTEGRYQPSGECVDGECPAPELPLEGGTWEGPAS